jgi:Zn-dependent peptidase ImmA (M78 family)/transcriptional regulator with XRE-family HTH domain
MFSGERLRQARELLSLTQTDLARLVGRSQAAIANIEAGLLEPSAEVAESIANRTRFPLTFFTDQPRFHFPAETLMFRARASATRRETIAACRHAEVSLELIELLETSVTQIPVRLQKSSQTPEVAAQHVRHLFGIGADQPVSNLIDLVERIGVTALALPIDLVKIDAFSTWLTTVGKRPIIAACRNKPGDRLRFSVAHELGHLALHGELKRLRPEEHQQADRFAAELLLPGAAMRKEIETPVTLSRIAPLKPRWGVSIQALVRRAHDLGIIANRQYRYLFEQLSARGWRTNEPSNLAVAQERPRALRKMAEVVYGTPIDFGRFGSDARLSLSYLKDLMDGYAEAPTSATETMPSAKVIQLRSS